MNVIAVDSNTATLAEDQQVEVFNLDLDEEVLSHLAIPQSIHAFRDERTDSELIEDEEIRLIYEWQMAHVREHGRPATASVLAEQFDLDFQPPLTAPGDLVARLRERYAVNRTRERMEQVANAYRKDPLLVPQTMIQVGRDLGRLVNQQGEAFGTGDVDRVMEIYDQRALRGLGPSLGFKELDDYFWGMRGIVMAIGSPKSGKSWIGVKGLLENILAGRNCWHYSLELPAQETNERLYALAANVSPWKWIKGHLTREDRNLVLQIADILDEQGNYRIVKPEPGDRRLPVLVERARDAGAEVIFFDQLQYIENDKGIALGMGDHKDYWNVLNAARDLSDEIPLWIAHQFNRTAMFADQMPEMQQAKGAAACEETASLILGLWANKDMRRSGVMELGTLASRHFFPQSWEIGMDLNRGCKFECLGIAEHDESD